MERDGRKAGNFYWLLFVIPHVCLTCNIHVLLLQSKNQENKKRKSQQPVLLKRRVISLVRMLLPPPLSPIKQITVIVTSQS